ncbi:tripartite tricarboxylate transporter substrate binding protein [Paracidovorax avenae]
MDTVRRWIIAAAAAGACGLAAAQEFKQPIRIVVPFAAGGATDAVARILGPGLSRELGQPVIIDNRPGASGLIGSNVVKNAAPDGATLLFALDHSLVVAPLITPGANYDAVRDFQALGTVTRFQWVFQVPLASPARNLADFMQLARSRPELRSFGVPVLGGMPELMGTAIGAKAGAPFEQVPFPGSAQLMPLLIGGQLPAGVTGSPEAVQLAKGRKVRALAITGDKRSPLFPDVPTFEEQGIPHMTISSFNAFFGPKALPAALAARFNAALLKTLQDPEVRSKIADMSLDLEAHSTLEAAAAELRQDYDFWHARSGRPAAPRP